MPHKFHLYLIIICGQAENMGYGNTSRSALASKDGLTPLQPRKIRDAKLASVSVTTICIFIICYLPRMVPNVLEMMPANKEFDMVI